MTTDKSAVLNNKKCLKIASTAYGICLQSVKDSRCPTGVVCVWEGDAAAELSLMSETENIPFTLHTHNTLRQDTIIKDLKIELLNISPYPNADIPIDPNDYLVELSITEQ
ncbi:MAG: hypothetical protein ACK5MZ_11575 [Aestuariibaculum sp.]